MEKEYFTLLIFGDKTSKSRHLRVPKKTVKIVLYLFAFAVLSITFFICDYIQVRKEGFELSRLRQEAQHQKSQIHFFSARIEDLEKQLSKLKDLDKRIRIIANLETGQETAESLQLFLEEVDHPALAVNLDPANMILYDKGDPVAAVHTLAPWIKHVLVKDALRTKQPGTWWLNWRRMSS